MKKWDTQSSQCGITFSDKNLTHVWAGYRVLCKNWMYEIKKMLLCKILVSWISYKAFIVTRVLCYCPPYTTPFGLPCLMIFLQRYYYLIMNTHVPFCPFYIIYFVSWSHFPFVWHRWGNNLIMKWGSSRTDGITRWGTINVGSTRINSPLIKRVASKHDSF